MHMKGWVYQMMEKNSMEFKEKLYEIMNGYFNSVPDWFLEDELVKDEFAEDGFCSRHYKEVYDANRRICGRLGVEEDKDVETIITGLLEIGKYQCFKMYDYGMYYSHKDH